MRTGRMVDCSTGDHSCKDSNSQSYENTGPLKLNRDLKQLEKLPQKANGNKVYSYVVATVKREGSKLLQKGCAPNFQVGLITLCTCKHKMRTYRHWRKWPGVWIAGFSGAKHGNALFYLMRVKHAYESHYDLWRCLSKKAREAKSSHRDRFGDVYEPKEEDLHDDDPTRFLPEGYYPPVECHPHCSKSKWKKDVNYNKGVSGRGAALLVGDPEMSFLWSTPQVFFNKKKGKLLRGEKKFESLEEFLDHLKYIERKDRCDVRGKGWAVSSGA